MMWCVCDGTAAGVALGVRWDGTPGGSGSEGRGRAGRENQLHAQLDPPPQVITPRTDCFNHKLASQVRVGRVLCMECGASSHRSK